MRIFPKKTTPERELAALKEQRNELYRSFAAAEATLQRARERVDGGDRSDDAIAAARNAEDRLHLSEQDCASIEEQIEEAQARVAEAEAKAAHDKAAAERTALVDKLDALLPNLERMFSELGSAAKPLAETPLRHPQEVSGLNADGNALLQRWREFVAFDRAQIASGNIPMPCPAPAREPLIETPVFVGERKTVILTRAGKWKEGKTIHTAGKCREVNLPTEIADLALQHQHAVLPGTDAARVLLQEFGTPDYAHHPEDTCVDLAKPRPVYFDERRVGPVHSQSDAFDYDQKASFVRDGKEKVGTATAVPRF